MSLLPNFTAAPGENRAGVNGGAAAGEGRPLRVCHLAKFYPPATGGIETHVRTLAQAQARLGAEVRVVCVNHRDRQGRDVTWARFARTPTVEEADGAVRLTRLGKRASVCRLEVCPGLPLLGARLRRWGVDVVHLHVPNPTMLLALAGFARRFPLVVGYHSDVVRQKVLGMVLRPFEALVYARAAAMLAASPPYATGSPVLRRYAPAVSVLPYGIDLGPYLRPGRGAREQAGRLRDASPEPLWLAVGRLVYYKGLHSALDALKHVPGRLLVIGEGPLAGPLRQRAEEMGLADRVVWRGRADADELVGAYHAATALWFPSNARSEAFGLVQVEAMASGCPVINTHIPDSGVAWVSRHEESGLTVAPDDALALAGAARRLLDEPGLRERLGGAGRARAAAEFDDETMARRTLTIYREVQSLDSRQAPRELRPALQECSTTEEACDGR
jgi:rhamnosyl/mannosyltransferase